MSYLTSPLTFEPIFMERVWGGRKLESLYRKKIPTGKRIGESWELVDRPEAQSIVCNGTLAGRSLHDLWVNFREDIFGNVPDAPRFPLLIKLLDCQERLSLQVHPPEEVARETGGEAKTEAWFIVEAAPGAELSLGLRAPTQPGDFEAAVKAGTAEKLVRRIPVKKGDAFVVPSGRMHSIGAGNLILEVQENSDTTYRIFDWNRVDKQRRPRALHLREAIRCIDFNDCNAKATQPNGESVIAAPLFAIDRWKVDSTARELSLGRRLAIVFCLSGELVCAGLHFSPGDFFLLPARAENRTVQSFSPEAELLRITIPE